jgi:hypothetical protein
MQTCKYCSVAVDPAIAGAAAELQDKVNRACSDASYLKTAALAMLVFLGLSFIPFLPLVFWGFLFTFLAVIFMLIRWQVKFGSLVTSDPDYVRARRSKNLALALWIAAVILFIVREIFYLFLSGLLS